ncbi:DUF3617 domain-containing protein [Chitinilyticum aquatile]|uniref:DUF3617 domain-containing protein n=1 Tax=Chitinilyticum aquatile TaxID=362520 RepID=UPI00040387E7|nr:DUF3617 family protein [Chitinilyticum aquatile]
MRLCVSLLLTASLSPFVLASETAPITPLPGEWAITTALSTEQLDILRGIDSATLKALEQNQLHYDLKAGTRTVTVCLSKQALASWYPGMSELQGASDCAAPMFNAKGNTLSVEYRCSQPDPLTLTGQYQFSAARDSYTFEHRVERGSAAPLVQQGKARRAGDC